MVEFIGAFAMWAMNLFAISSGLPPSSSIGGGAPEPKPSKEMQEREEAIRQEKERQLKEEARQAKEATKKAKEEAQKAKEEKEKQKKELKEKEKLEAKKLKDEKKKEKERIKREKERLKIEKVQTEMRDIFQSANINPEAIIQPVNIEAKSPSEEQLLTSANPANSAPVVQEAFDYDFNNFDLMGFDNPEEVEKKKEEKKAEQKEEFNFQYNVDEEKKPQAQAQAQASVTQSQIQPQATVTPAKEGRFAKFVNKLSEAVKSLNWFGNKGVGNVRGFDRLIGKPEKAEAEAVQPPPPSQPEIHPEMLQAQRARMEEFEKTKKQSQIQAQTYTPVPTIAQLPSQTPSSSQLTTASSSSSANVVSSSRVFQGQSLQKMLESNMRDTSDWKPDKDATKIREGITVSEKVQPGNSYTIYQDKITINSDVEDQKKTFKKALEDYKAAFPSTPPRITAPDRQTAEVWQEVVKEVFPKQNIDIDFREKLGGKPAPLSGQQPPPIPRPGPNQEADSKSSDNNQGQPPPPSHRF